jgi:hypothetical protein
MREKCVQIYQNMFLKGEDVGWWRGTVGIGNTQVSGYAE